MSELPLDRSRLLPTLLAVACAALAWAAIAPGVATADPPANDSFENPRTVPPSQGWNNSTYTAQPGEPAHAGVVASHSRWFQYTNATTEDLTVQVDTCGSAVDTVLSAYEPAPDFAGLTSLAEDDDGAAGDPGCAPGDSKILFTATAGTSYLFAVDSKVAASTGSLLFTIRPQPPNANFADAIPIPAAGGVVSGANFFAGAEPGEPAHAGQPATNSAWYSFTPLGNGSVTIDACESSIDTVLAVYTGTAVGALTPIASNDDTAGCGTGDTRSRVQFAPVPGQTYLIAVDGKTAAVQGNFRIDLQAPPQNDLFAGSTELPPVAFQQDGTLSSNAGSEPGEPAILGDPAEHSVWYRWTAPRSGPVRIDTCSSDFDTMLAVYTGSSLGTLTEVASDDDGAAALPGCEGGDSRLEFAATAGQEYRIAIDGKAGAAGLVHLVLMSKPLNDDFAESMHLNDTSDFGSGYTDLATDEPGEPQHGGVGSGHSLWYSWTAPVGGIVELATCSSDADTVLAVYTGGALGALTPVAANDDAAGETNCSETDSALSFGASAGTTYRIAVDAVSGEGLVEVGVVRPTDTTAPDTAITGGPSGTIAAREATFTYSGSPGFDVASFECRLDGAAFGPCPKAGRSLSGLALGAHEFAVRAIDFDANADPTPATRRFTVADPINPPADCSAAEAKLAKAKAKLKQAKAKVEDAESRSAVARAKAKVKKAKAKVKTAKAGLAVCRA